MEFGNLEYIETALMRADIPVEEKNYFAAIFKRRAESIKNKPSNFSTRHIKACEYAIGEYGRWARLGVECEDWRQKIIEAYNDGYMLHFHQPKQARGFRSVVDTVRQNNRTSKSLDRY